MCIRDRVDLGDHVADVRVLGDRLVEPRGAAQRRGLPGDLGDDLGGRVERRIGPALGCARPRGVRDLRVDHDDAAVAGPDRALLEPDLLDAGGDRTDDIAVVRMAGEGVPDVAGAQQVEAGQPGVAPVARPFAARPRRGARTGRGGGRALPADRDHASILRPPRGRRPARPQRGRTAGGGRPSARRPRCQWSGARWRTWPRQRSTRSPPRPAVGSPGHSARPPPRRKGPGGPSAPAPTSWWWRRRAPARPSPPSSRPWTRWRARPRPPSRRSAAGCCTSHR